MGPTFRKNSSQPNPRNGNMRNTLLLTALLGLAAFTPPVPVEAGVGSPLPEVKLEGFTQTKAETFDDFFGRAVLIEFFAHW